MTDSKKEANNRYFRKFDDIKIRVKKGNREKYKEYAKSKNMSLNSLFIKLLEEDMEKSYLSCHNGTKKEEEC